MRYNLELVRGCAGVEKVQYLTVKQLIFERSQMPSFSRLLLRRFQVLTLFSTTPCDIGTDKSLALGRY